jgi:aminopeptidase N
MRFIILLLAITSWGSLHAQHTFTRQDSLRGTLSPLRSCYDVTYYDLNVRVKPETKTISGYNEIQFKALSSFNEIQIDLFENMVIDQIIYQDYPLAFTREGNAVFIRFGQMVQQGTQGSIKVYYQGAPIVAARPPWDGGFTWTTDKEGRPWIAVSCEGIGASLWWPNKDHLSDEPDSMRIYCEVPESLMCVANGNLISTQKVPGAYKGYEWKVSYPINNYNVSLNIAHYAHFNDVYVSQKDTLALDYYVLTYNLDKAKAHFEQVKPMLACYEQLFGPYPFWNDGYAMVETPYWGMEHQSAVAYGNNYKNNEWGFDFIIIHESGHEYFGNSLSVADHAEMWIHEAFTTYAEALYLECVSGGDFKKSIAYLETQKKRIANKEPILGPMGVNYHHWKDSDMYFKGTWMLHTLRSVVADDQRWFATIKKYTETFKRSIVNTEQTIDFFSRETGKNLRPVFNQYLRYAAIPKLKYYTEKKGKKLTFFYRWEAAEPGFNMPVKVRFADEAPYIEIKPGTSFKSISVKGKEPKFATELYYFVPEEEKPAK